MNHKTSRWGRSGFTLLLITYLVFKIFGNTVYASEPYIPQDENEILTKLSISSNKLSKKIGSLRKQFKKVPNDIQLATQLAKEYIQIARVNTDVRYYGYAKNLLTPWWKQEKPPAQVLILRATLNQQKHDYVKAIKDLKLLLKSNPSHTQAWLTLSIIQQVLGDYQSARASCSALARTSSSWLSTLCYSQVLSLTGSAKKAFEIQQSVLLQLGSSGPDLQQWVLGINAETALRLGKKDQAEKLFKKALKISSRDAYLMRIYSDYLLKEQRGEEVLEILEGEEQDSALLLRMALAAKQTKRKKLLSSYKQSLEARFRAATLRGSKLHERDEALYLLEFNGDTKRALTLARKNWSIQKEPDDALLFLRIALVNGSQKDIDVVRNWVVKSQLQDPRIQTLLLKGNE